MTSPVKESISRTPSSIHKVIVGCPMGERIFRYKIKDAPVEYTKATPFFTGDKWIENLAESEYPNLSMVVNANDLTSESIEKIEATRALLSYRSTILYTNTGRDTVDERGARRYQAKVNAELPYQHFASIRNKLLNHIVHMTLEDKTIKYFVSADSDIMTHPDTIPRLVDIMEKDTDIGICGIPVNNDRRTSETTPDGLGWGHAQYSFGEWVTFTENNPKLSNVRPLRSFPINSGVMKVGYTGAFCIIRISLLLPPHQIRYASHKQGEDVPFCHAIKQSGYKLCVDTDQVSLHMQDPRLFSRDKAIFEQRELI